MVCTFNEWEVDRCVSWSGIDKDTCTIHVWISIISTTNEMEFDAFVCAFVCVYLISILILIHYCVCVHAINMIIMIRSLL